jgi:hypothetical protein
MALVQNPADFDALNHLLNGGEVEHVRDMLASVDIEDESYLVLRIKMGVLDGSLAPGAAMQRLIQLMRRHADWPAAKELYQWTSERAYQEHESSAALSHIPPPVKAR